MPWWLIVIWSIEVAWIVYWWVPALLSNQHGRRARQRQLANDYSVAPNWAAYVRDHQVYLMEHSFKPDKCLCVRCVPNKWKGDWTYARDRADRDHRGNAGANPVAGTLASSPSLAAAAQLAAAGASAGLISQAAAQFIGNTVTTAAYQWVCPGCSAAILLPNNGVPVQHSCPAGYSVTYQYSTLNGEPLGLRHESLPRRKLPGVDYVMGFRSWALEYTGDSFRLAAHNGITWLGQRAIHNGRPELCPESPLCQAPAGYAPGRACGYHAYDHWQRLGESQATKPIIVNGICKMWGIIVRHGDGFRAQYAAPVALFRNASMLLDLRPLADALGLPLIDERDPFGVAREHGYVWGDPLPNSSSGVDESGPPGAP